MCHLQYLMHRRASSSLGTERVCVYCKNNKITSQSLFVTAHLQKVKCVFVCVLCNELWGQSRQFICWNLDPASLITAVTVSTSGNHLHYFGSWGVSKCLSEIMTTQDCLHMYTHTSLVCAIQLKMCFLTLQSLDLLMYLEKKLDFNLMMSSIEITACIPAF